MLIGDINIFLYSTKNDILFMRYIKEANMEKENKRIIILQNLGIVTLILVSLYYLNRLFGDQIDILFKAINSIVLPFGIALFISYLLAPIIKFIEHRFKIKKRWISVVLVILLLIVVATLFGLFIGVTIYNEASEFVDTDWNNILASIENYVVNNDFLNSIYVASEEYLTFESATPVIFDVLNILQGAIGIIVSIVLVPVFLVFLLHDKELIFNGILKTVPLKYRNHVKELGTRANEVIEKYFNGRFLSMFIVSIAFTIVLLIFGFSIDKAIFFGFTLGFLDIIPYIGGFIGIMLPVLFSFTITDQVLFGQWAFIGLISCNLVIQFLQGNVLQPLIMGKEVNIHPLLVLSSFIFFGALFGITGIILAIPITGTIKTSVEYYHTEFKPKEKKELIKKNT